MTKRMKRNVLLVAYVWNHTFSNAYRGNAQIFAQSAVVLPAFLPNQISIGEVPS